MPGVLSSGAFVAWGFCRLGLVSSGAFVTGAFVAGASVMSSGNLVREPATTHLSTTVLGTRMNHPCSATGDTCSLLAVTDLRLYNLEFSLVTLYNYHFL